MISSWLDVAGAVMLFIAGFLHLRRGEWRLRQAPRWWTDLPALLTALLGSMLLAMGLVLLLYSAAFAFITG